LPNIFKRFSQTSAVPYEFPDEADLVYEEPVEYSNEPVGREEPIEGNELEQKPEPEPPPKPKTPIDFANIQADALVEDARRQAQEILDRAAQEAQEKAKEIYDAAREDGYREGYAQGAAQAAQEGARQREEQAEALGEEVQKFLEQATAARDRQLEEHMDELRELAMAVAEKVVGVSLRSSSEVICRMIQTAVDKRKRKEWVRIYIAECDAKHLTEIPVPLASALSALSDRVRIIPVADDEPGTCIIETPDEIVDASAATQLNNIRGILMDAPAAGAAVNLY
jgi:flagellar assembly protein FliH